MSEIGVFLKWREVERHKRRIMTAAEYEMWRRGGDAISSPTEASAFPGGLTIRLSNRPLVIGQLPSTGKGGA